MKNAAKASLAVMATCLGLGMGLAAFSVEAIAAVGAPTSDGASAKTLASSQSSGSVALPSAAAPVVPAAPVSPTVNAPSTAAAALPPPVTATPVTATPATASKPTSDISVAGSSSGISLPAAAKKDDPADAKIPESVRGVMKKLSSSDDKATAQDLNDAREAVAKLDLLVEIEKRLKDLSAIRAEREEKSGASSLAGAIPASALGLNGKKAAIPSLSPMQAVMATQMNNGSPIGMPVMPAATKIELERIVGARGNYLAFLRVGDEHAKQYKVGDKLSDGRVIQSITSHGVTLGRKNKVETLKVRGVSNIFGAP